jgi:3-dehydrosphinganine reductase
MRMEAMRYSSSAVTYHVQCAFPSNFISESFIEEQKCKPQLTKEMEGTAADISELGRKFPSTKKVADYIVANIDSRDFALYDSTESSLLWANIIVPPPKSGLGILDTLMAFLVGLIVWPILRRQWDAKCKKDHYKLKQWIIRPAVELAVWCVSFWGYNNSCNLVILVYLVYVQSDIQFCFQLVVL